ncbi:MAG: YfiR family protein [Bacteroidetes bacterium]|nr:MAG: YfiR family protein [Bacteroidota bacterium]
MFMCAFFIKVYTQSYTEYEVKAAYIFNFAKFVKWPDNSFSNKTSPFVLGIYGNNPFGVILTKTIQNRTVNGRKWVIKFINNPKDVQNCHLLFISQLKKSELYRVLNETKNKPILTIGDNIEDFCISGGILNFTQQYSKHRFEINKDIAIQSNLIISSKLLILAKIISSDEIKF